MYRGTADKGHGSMPTNESQGHLEVKYLLPVFVCSGGEYSSVTLD